MLDKNNPPPASYLEHAAAEEKFRDEYLKRTGQNNIDTIILNFANMCQPTVLRVLPNYVESGRSPYFFLFILSCILGLIWRHFHGPDGPRAKPFLHMWPAPAIGHKHTIKSSHGFW